MKKLQKPILRADTRSRLVESAVTIFAECGYHAATTRRICVRARANAAAVNYHFGGKLGLYEAALETLIERQRMVGGDRNLEALRPEQALATFVHAMFRSLAGSNSAHHYARLMAHEMAEPTPGLSMVVQKMIEPRARLLCGIVSRLTCTPARSRQTRLIAHSIIAQIVHYTHAMPVINLLWPNWRIDAAARRLIADHVTQFSLSGLNANTSAVFAAAMGRKPSAKTRGKSRRGRKKFR